jgi:phage terminase large subunit-like protein
MTRDRSAITPAYVLAHIAPPEFWESLTEAERLVLPYMYDLWLRPEQRLPQHRWRACGCLAGRGFGKTFVLAQHINSLVEQGRTPHVALMASNEDRTDELQIESLIQAAPPWFRPERYRGGVRWPNGVRAVTFTPQAPGGPRGENIGITWLSEIVAWPATTRREAYDNITTATRVGPAQVLWDTTSMGRNEIIQLLLTDHAHDPHMHPIVRGSIFDNPMLTRAYIAAECRKYSGRRAREELWGDVYTGAAGALWQQSVIDKHRVELHPENPAQSLVSIDPAQSARADADETGMVAGSRGRDGHVYVREDVSARMTPDEWGNKALDMWARYECDGIIVERNKLGDNAAFTLVAAARTRGLRVNVIPRTNTDPIPARVPGAVNVRETLSTTSKYSRADGPSAETDAGRVHHVGHFHELEFEQTTYVPDGKESPNRYDAFTQLVTELAGLGRVTIDTAAESAAAAAAHNHLKTTLGAVIRGRRVGL